MEKSLEGYDEFLYGIKARIHSAQVRAALALSREVVLLYWHIGREILERQTLHGWGTNVVQRIANDLQAAFPGVEGFSRRNLLYMRSFADAYPDSEIVHQLVHNSPLPWKHYTRTLEKVKEAEPRAWYLRAAYEHGWSRAILEHQIDTNLYERQSKAINNFAATLPPLQSDLAQQILKDPYNFDFLTLSSDAHERQMERGLLENLRNFLLEMGAGFALVGCQYHLEVGGKDYYIDLLFYHLRLRCFVVVDLKIGEFMPEYAGKMNFYLSAVDDLLRHPQDAPSIGLLLCKSRDSVTVEYALRNTSTPIAVAEFVTSLPSALAESLPAVETLESNLAYASDMQEEGASEKPAATPAPARKTSASRSASMKRGNSSA